jgi:protein-S-isoprenylcysteine O-methyltransferase Ste14
MLTQYFVHNRSRMSQPSAPAAFALSAISDTRWEQTLTEAALFPIGAVLVGVATIGRIWCSMYLVGHKNGTLITVGPYSITRHRSTSSP